MNEKLKTEKEEQRERRNRAIRSEYNKLVAANPLASSWRVCCHLSKNYGLTPVMINKIVK